MEIKEIGRMIHTMRIQYAVSQKELCRGICSTATLSRLETGERRPDILVFNALFQRLGKSATHIHTILTLEEFEYFSQRKKIESFISEKNFLLAEKELKLLEAAALKKDLPLLRQDIYLIYTLLYLQKEEEQTAEVYVQKALTETIPDINNLDFMHERFCESEINLVLLYVYIREKLGKDEIPLLEHIIQYIDSKITDEKLKNKEAAIALYLRAAFYQKETSWPNCYKCCEEAISSAVKNASLFILFLTLDMEMECLKHGCSAENGNLRKKQYESLKKVLEEYGECTFLKSSFSFFEIVLQQKSLIDEVVRLARLRSEYSQESLSEGICAPETLSRIENGKRNPTFRNFHAFMQKTESGTGYYNTDFEIEHFETLEKIADLYRLSFNKNYTEIEKLAEELAKELDMNQIVNRQQLTLYFTISGYRLGKITIEEALKHIELALELSVPRSNGRFSFPYQLTDVEISLFNQLAVYYRNLGNPRQAVEILTSIYEYLHQSRLEAPELSRRYFMIMANLYFCLEQIGESEKSLKIAEESIAAQVRFNYGLQIGAALVHKGYILERQGNKDYLSSYEQGYYLCNLFHDTVTQANLKNYLKDHDELWK